MRMSSFSSRSLALAAAVGLTLTVAACGSSREVRVLNDDGTEVGLHDSSPRVARTIGHGRAPSAKEQEVASLPMPSAKEIAAAPDPFALKGADAKAVTEALGTATLLRREPPAQVWLYRGRTCVLDFVLYPDTGGAKTKGRDKKAAKAGLTVAHIELRPITPGRDVFPKACAADIRQGRAARS